MKRLFCRFTFIAVLATSGIILLFLRSFRGRDVHEVLVIPTQPQQKSETNDFGHPEGWSVFNQEYQNPLRRFRLNFPPAFEIVDRDSSMVWITKGEKFYLGIEESHYYTGFNREEFDHYYSSYMQMPHRKLPDLSTLDRIDLNENDFLYRFIDTINDKERFLYRGVIDGHGIEILDPKNLPEGIVFSIIQSIEFQ